MLSHTIDLHLGVAILRLKNGCDFSKIIVTEEALIDTQPEMHGKKKKKGGDSSSGKKKIFDQIFRKSLKNLKNNACSYGLLLHTLTKFWA